MVSVGYAGGLLKKLVLMFVISNLLHMDMDPFPEFVTQRDDPGEFFLVRIGFSERAVLAL